jgi:UDP-N-acetylglucosamine--N-acetylmuramyl-(pentapeptide) pyrophosphoryl-undecaprenol N-acetylglucosamine transferase
MKKIILTGGGTAGHVTPNLALVPKLKEAGFDICYVGSYNGMEKDLVQKANIPYRGISSGKLRRYFDVKNFTDPFRVIKGFSEAKKIMKEYKPDVLFSKGGFVTVPVVLAAKKYKVPIVSHESDMTPGLANKITLSSCTRICCNFPETLNYLPSDKAVLTGCPIRGELLTGNRLEGLKLTGFNSDKPILLIIGGSLGSVKVNQAVREILPRLIEDYQVVHLCGKGNLDETLTNMPGYVQYEYMSDPLKHLFAMADIVISRAGANAICELLALKKPALLIPLSAAASRGDQILNANSFKKQGFSEVLEEEQLSATTLYEAVTNLYKNRNQYIEKMQESNQSDAVSMIVDMLSELANKKQKGAQ